MDHDVLYFQTQAKLSQSFQAVEHPKGDWIGDSFSVLHGSKKEKNCEKLNPKLKKKKKVVDDPIFVDLLIS